MSKTYESKRPKANTLVQFDSNNYYSQLGISPLTPTNEIKSLIVRKQNEVKNSRRYQAEQKFGFIEDEFIKLQKIDEALCSDKKREIYDRMNPQNELLTIQLNSIDIWFDHHYQADFVTTWLLEEFGQSSFLPSASSVALWTPSGIDSELIKLLETYQKENIKKNDEGQTSLLSEIDIIISKNK
jgi:hypothetical protein